MGCHGVRLPPHLRRWRWVGAQLQGEGAFPLNGERLVRAQHVVTLPSGADGLERRYGAGGEGAETP